MDPAGYYGVIQDPVCELEGVSKIFGTPERRVEAVLDANFTISRGEFITIVGPSGCGKSTLLAMIAGLTRPSSGLIRLRGDVVQGPSASIGYVPQRDSLLPWRTALRNVEATLELGKVRQPERRVRSLEALDKVGLTDSVDRYPHQLSGGMCQRVNIARALVRRPELVLMDEPFGPLDAMTRGALQAELLRLWSNQGMTVLFVTHDITEAIALSDRIIVMSSQPGRIKDTVDVDLSRPRDVFQVHQAKGYEACHARVWSLVADEAAR